MDAKVIVTREDAVLRIVFNRPEKKNALDRQMYLTMIAALEEAQADSTVKAVLFCGAGGAFTAGNDLADFHGGLAPGEEFPALRFVKTLAAFEKPLVAAVAGEAVGVGATMLFHCDLAYAAPNAIFRAPFVDLGLIPEGACSLLAPRLFGQAKAAQFLLLCEALDASEALRLNLVNAILPPQTLLETAAEAARRLAQKPARALQEARRLMRGDRTEILRRIDEEARLFAEALASPEVQARLIAFFNRDRS